MPRQSESQRILSTNSEMGNWLMCIARSNETLESHAVIGGKPSPHRAVT